jgi:hypothetical protein
VAIRRESIGEKIARSVVGERFVVPERPGCGEGPWPCFDGDFVVEIPRTVDVSVLTGSKASPEKLKFYRVDDIDEPVKVEEI